VCHASCKFDWGLQVWLRLCIVGAGLQRTFDCTVYMHTYIGQTDFNPAAFDKQQHH